MGRRKKPDTEAETLSRRERQIMDIIYKRGAATAGEVREALEDPPSYSAVRALLRVLEDKGHLQHDTQGNRYVYRPTRSRAEASRAALHRVVETFFEGSALRAAAALLDERGERIDEDDLDALESLLEKARKEGR